MLYGFGIFNNIIKKETTMQTIKIDIVDFYKGFDKNDNWIVRILRKKYDIEISDKPDFLFYSCFSNEFEKYHDCVKIFIANEHVVPNFNQCDYASTCHNIVFGNRFFKRYFSLQNPAIMNRSAVTDDMVNRRFCNFIYANMWQGSQINARQEFCKKLMEYKHVDCPGRVLHNMDAEELSPRHGGGDWQKSKLEFLKKYKFTIAFENAIADDYITEKLFDPLRSFSVPIYFGAPNVVREANPKSFINANDYNNDFDAVIERVKYLDTHDDEYLAMLREQPMQPDYEFDRWKKFEDWLCNIIEKGNKPFDNSVYLFLRNKKIEQGNM